MPRVSESDKRLLGSGKQSENNDTRRGPDVYLAVCDHGHGKFIGYKLVARGIGAAIVDFINQIGRIVGMKDTGRFVLHRPEQGIGVSIG